jgi:hypothetical protein
MMPTFSINSLIGILLILVITLEDWISSHTYFTPRNLSIGCIFHFWNIHQFKFNSSSYSAHVTSFPVSLFCKECCSRCLCLAITFSNITAEHHHKEIQYFSSNRCRSRYHKPESTSKSIFRSFENSFVVLRRRDTCFPVG